MNDQANVNQASNLELDSLQRRVAILEEREADFRFLAENMGDVVFIVDMELRTTYVSPSIERILGYTPAERITQKVAEQLTPQSQKLVFEVLAEELALEKTAGADKNRSRTLELEYYHKDGSIKCLETYIRGARDSNGTLTGFYGLSRDITERKQAEEALRESEKRFRRVSNIISDVVYSCKTNVEGRFTIDWMTGAVERISGYSIQEIKVQECWRFLVVEEDLDLFEKNIADLTPGSHGKCELRIRHKNGGTVWIASYAECVMGSEPPEHFHLHGALIDITVRKRTEDALRETEEKLQMALNGAEMGMWDLELSTMSGTIDERAAQILGYQKDDISPKIHDWDEMTHPDDVPGIKECIQAHIEGRMPVFKTDHRMRTATGDWKWVHGRGKITKRHKDGSPIRISGTIHDITEHKLAEEKLAYFAIHDQLTGLLNRRSFEEMLNRTIARAKRGAVSSILYMDLDNFKEVNDSVGHSVGDKVLITIACLLKGAVRSEDTVFRLGGDEFAVLLDGMTGSDSLPAAERLRAVVEAHRFELDGRLFPLTLSIGLKEIDGALTMGELLSQADIAMYKAKAQGKNQVVLA